MFRATHRILCVFDFVVCSDISLLAHATYKKEYQKVTAARSNCVIFQWSRNHSLTAAILLIGRNNAQKVKSKRQNPTTQKDKVKFKLNYSQSLSLTSSQSKHLLKYLILSIFSCFLLAYLLVVSTRHKNCATSKNKMQVNSRVLRWRNHIISFIWSFSYYYIIFLFANTLHSRAQKVLSNVSM
jgi:hypothetical protein